MKGKVDGKVFLLVTNHLARGNAEIRQAQAVGLREWARDQTLPVICVGNFNFDYNFADENGNEAFREFMRDGVWKWVKSAEWIDTNWADRNDDDIDDNPGLRVRRKGRDGVEDDLPCYCAVG